jgi:hypothetical protein
MNASDLLTTLRSIVNSDNADDVQLAEIHRWLPIPVDYRTRRSTFHGEEAEAYRTPRFNLFGEEAEAEVDKRVKRVRRVCDQCAIEVAGKGVPKQTYRLVHECGHRLCQQCLPDVSMFHCCVVCKTLAYQVIDVHS